MSYKPDEATLISYLYGELEGRERKVSKNTWKRILVDKEDWRRAYFRADGMARLDDKDGDRSPDHSTDESQISSILEAGVISECLWASRRHSCLFLIAAKILAFRLECPTTS